MKKFLIPLAIIVLVAVVATSCKKSCICHSPDGYDIGLPDPSTPKKECLEYNQPGSYISCKWE